MEFQKEKALVWDGLIGLEISSKRGNYQNLSVTTRRMRGSCQTDIGEGDEEKSALGLFIARRLRTSVNRGKRSVLP